MSLPAPNLDDRKFQDIVDDVKRQIGLRCPEWTDHNVSDPGVTLIELFSWMFEMMLYRMNQVPEKNYIKFLEMLGISLEPPTPARTELRFLLSRPIEDEEGEEAYEVTLPAVDTIAATVRTDTDEAVEFATDRELRMVRPKLAAVIAAPFEETAADPAAGSMRKFVSDGKAFPIFSPNPRRGDALYFGFETDVSSNLLQLDVDANEAAPVGLNRDFPLQVWEYWNGADGQWDRLPERPIDGSCGFAQNGVIDLAMPAGLIARQVGGLRAYWIRVRYTSDLDELPSPPSSYTEHQPYQKPPEITKLYARTTGGTAPASNCATMRMEALGQSDGTPGQVFRTQRAPVLPRRPGETILVGPLGASIEELDEWTEVEDFSESGPEDRHFLCDSFSGEIFFGPNVLRPDGSARQHGAVPDRSATIYLSRYRYGGGVSGNVREGRVTVLKSSIPYIAQVTNVIRADGGRDQEDIEHAKMRGRAYLRIRERAVTAEDYEHLAKRATSGVGRAHCVQAGRIHSAGDGGSNIPPGVVKVLIVPALGEGLTVPRPIDLKVPLRTVQEVQNYLDERRLLTTVLEVGAPEYVYVSTDITFVANPRADQDDVARRVREALERYLHPLYGGPAGDGWPFRRALTLADLYAQIGEVQGVAFLLEARIYQSRMTNDRLGDEQRVRNEEGVRLGPGELICTREHRIRPVELWRVGEELT